jgi:hypothetical protein
MRKTILWIIVGGVALMIILELVTLGQSTENPPVVQEPNWDSLQTRELAKRACFDCHSNETVWPWYSKVIPIAWLIRRDVNEGRRHLNFTDMKASDHVHGVDEIAEIIQEGEMPPSYYTMLHPSARMTAAEKDALIQGLIATTGATGGGGSDD